METTSQNEYEWMQALNAKAEFSQTIEASSLCGNPTKRVTIGIKMPKKQSCVGYLLCIIETSVPRKETSPHWKWGEVG